jgi:hypothetical protein
MPLSFPKTAQSAFLVGRTPWSAADAHVGLLGLDESDFTGEERVQGNRADQDADQGSAPRLHLDPQF